MKYMKLLAAIAAVLISVPAAQSAPRRKAPTASELIEQAREAFYAYNPELAQEKIDAARRLRKGFDADSLSAFEERVERMESMIQRVEDIRIIDSISVNRDDFFRHYRLSAASGSIMGVDELDRGVTEIDRASLGNVAMPLDSMEVRTAYMPESGTSVIWTSDYGLMESRRLTDGSWEPALFLGEALNAGGTASFPFLMPDGVTLYYATDGDDSLGGLDLYISRRNRDGFPTPQNMGMPYNSPFDDYMLAIDEETGAGWWASDRNRLDGLVTIYVFIPNETRVNLDVNAPDLAERAGASNLADKWDEDSRSAMLAKISAIQPMGLREDNTPDFELALPDGRIYTRWSDFRNPQARRMMENYVDALADYEADTEALESMRAKYRPGNRDLAAAIVKLEKKILDAQSTLLRLSNQVISAEVK